MASLIAFDIFFVVWELSKSVLEYAQHHLRNTPDLMLQESRRAARTSPGGDLILLEQQDRSLWNRHIAEGISLTESALRSRRSAAYIRSVATDSAIPGCRTEPRSGYRHVRRSGAGSSSH